jgi:hypothetical protein
MSFETSAPTPLPGSSLHLSARPTAVRRTPHNDFGQVLHRSVLAASGAAQRSLQWAGAYLPAGGVVSAALAAPGQLTGGSGPGLVGSDSLSTAHAMAELQAGFSLQYLQLQQRIQQETREFNLVSNVLKTKHEAAKNALANVR